jgi:hypothetical protein
MRTPVGGEPQYPRHLPGRVSVLLTGILPLEWGFALVIGRRLRTPKPSLSVFREMAVLCDGVDEWARRGAKPSFHLR